MKLAIFDLDHTLLSGDSDFEWGQYLISLGVVEAEAFERENQRFFDHYRAGTLDIHAYARFAFKPFTEHPMETLNQWRASFLKERILPVVRPRGRRLIEAHRAKAHELMVITSTNRFIAEPITEFLGFRHLIATEPAMLDGRFTGEIAGEPCLGAGKVLRLEAWLAEHGLEPEETWFYSDSHNDLPLMKWADHPIAVDPDKRLAGYAAQKGWPIISLA